MNRSKVKEWLPIFKAFSDGDEIQERSVNSGWIRASSIDTTMSPSFYRIKPQPEVIWVNKYKSCSAYIHETASDAIKCARNDYGNEYIAKRFVESPELDDE